jgi:hypothetical protein
MVRCLLCKKLLLCAECLALGNQPFCEPCRLSAPSLTDDMDDEYDENGNPLHPCEWCGYHNVSVACVVCGKVAICQGCYHDLGTTMCEDCELKGSQTAEAN